MGRRARPRAVMRAEVASLSVLLLVSVPWVAGSFSPFTESVSLVERTLDGASCSLPTSFQVNSASAVSDVYSSLSAILVELDSTVSAAQLSIQNNGGRADASQSGTQDVQHRPQRQLQVVLPPIELPPLESRPNGGVGPPPPLITLAPNRTQRKNPLDNFETYKGGWDFFSSDYWASLGWTTVYGAAIGVVWVLFGLGFLVFLLIICVCCRFKWRSLRDGNPKYGRKQLALPLLFMLFGVLLECLGLGLMVGGAVKLKNDVNSLTSFTVGHVETVSNIVLNVTPILRRVADSENVFNITIANEVKQKLNSVANKADQLATNALQKAQTAQSQVNNALVILQDILFAVGCVTVGLVFLCLIFCLCKWVVASNIVTGIIWVLCLVTWILVTVFLFVWLFGGDTSVALGQVAYSPTDLTKFNFIVPCMDPNAVEDLGTFSRFAASTAITVVNATITQKAPIVFTLLRAPQGVCNPFGPAPNYTFYEGTCKDICPPYEQFCKGRTIDITTLADRFSSLKCNSTSVARCVSLTALTTSVAAVLKAGQALAQGVVDLLPALKGVLRCAYISYIATAIQGFVQGMETNALLMWLGFLFISVGAIFFSICAPIYVYRAVRAYGAHKGNTELEPMAPPMLAHADSHTHVEHGYGDQVEAPYAAPEHSAGAESVESSSYVKGPGKPGSTPWPSAMQFDPPSDGEVPGPEGAHVDCDASSAPKYEIPSWSKK